MGVGSVAFGAASVSDIQPRRTQPPRWRKHPTSRRPPPSPPLTHPEVARAARELLGKTRVKIQGKRYPADCSGLVRGLYAASGIDLFDVGFYPKANGVARIYRYVARQGRLHHGTPRPGEIVFFDNTYDRNRDGRRNDPLTHVGVVEEVHRNGTVVVIHFGSGSVQRLNLNLSKPTRREDGRGNRLNDQLRRGDARRGLASQLFVAFGSLPANAAPARLASLY